MDIGIIAFAVSLLCISSRASLFPLVTTCALFILCNISEETEEFVSHIVIIVIVYCTRNRFVHVMSYALLPMLLLASLFCSPSSFNQGCYYFLPIATPLLLSFTSSWHNILRNSLWLFLLAISLCYFQYTSIASPLPIEYQPISISANTYWYLIALSFPKYRLYFHCLYRVQPLLLSFPLALRLDLPHAVIKKLLLPAETPDIAC